MCLKTSNKGGKKLVICRPTTFGPDWQTSRTVVWISVKCTSYIHGTQRRDLVTPLSFRPAPATGYNINSPCNKSQYLVAELAQFVQTLMVLSWWIVMTLVISTGTIWTFTLGAHKKCAGNLMCLNRNFVCSRCIISWLIHPTIDGILQGLP